MHMFGHIAPVADAPDDQAGAADNVAGGEHAVEIGHHRLVIDAQCPPAGDGEIRGTKQARQIFGIKAQRLDHQIGVDSKIAVRLDFRRAAAGSRGETFVERFGTAIPVGGDT